MANDIKPEQVPEVVWSAFCESIYKYGYGPHAIAAGLAAWPGLTTEPRNWRTALILPLPAQEAGDGK